MKKIVVLCLFFLLFLCLVISIYYNSFFFIIFFSILFSINFIYLLYKIYRKYRGKVRVDYEKRNEDIKDVKKVSVVIPNYNYADYIEERIFSVLEQSYPVYEIIILDDCSSDNSVSVINNLLKELENKYSDVKFDFVVNKENSGNVFRQWKKAFELSTGNYLWICEADDLCDKDFLKVAMQGFNDENVVISYTESLQIDEHGDVTNNDFRHWADMFNLKIWNNNFIISGNDFLEKSLCINNSIVNASGVIFKKIDNNKINQYLLGAQEYKLSGDWYFYYKYLLHGSISYSADSLNKHRIHTNSVTSSLKENEKLIEISKIQDEIFKSINISMKYRRLALKYRKMVESNIKKMNKKSVE